LYHFWLSPICHLSVLMIEACFWKLKGLEQTEWNLISLEVCMPFLAVAEL